MNEARKRRSFWLTSKGLAAASLILAATFFLLTEHRAHVIPVLPWLIVLLCPLMHVFMHRHHGEHPRRDDRSDHSSEER